MTHRLRVVVTQPRVHTIDVAADGSCSRTCNHYQAGTLNEWCRLSAGWDKLAWPKRTQLCLDSEANGKETNERTGKIGS